MALHRLSILILPQACHYCLRPIYWNFEPQSYSANKCLWHAWRQSAVPLEIAREPSLGFESIQPEFQKVTVKAEEMFLPEEE
ncbi:hypothetical protein CRM22_008738, partial [Opisthorchis felineus]